MTAVVRYVRVRDVQAVASCANGTYVTIREGDLPLVMVGSAAEVQALGQRIIDASREAAAPRPTRGVRAD